MIFEIRDLQRRPFSKVRHSDFRNWRLLPTFKISLWFDEACLYFRRPLQFVTVPGAAGALRLPDKHE